MADSTRYADWLKKAKSDLSAAKILFENEGDNAIICFHCQQTIEKAMKGLILQRKQELIEGHSLVYLCKKAIEIDSNLKNFMKDCAYVNQFYLETRYPGDIPLDIDNDEAKDCITIAENILNEIYEIKLNCFSD